MVYRGRVQNGVIVLDEPAALPEGSVVQVEIAEVPEDIKSLRDGLLSLAGIVEGPPDLAVEYSEDLKGPVFTTFWVLIKVADALAKW